jgi:tetratricopeptide (TPR) repeat protein
MQVGGYTVIRELGRGGQGQVFEVVSHEGGPLLALKLCTSGDARAFDREVWLQSGLRHEGVVQLVDRGEHEGRPYVVMELVDGGSLADRLAARRLATAGTFDFEATAPSGADSELLSLVQSLCTPLAWLHGEGLVHADVKPANVLLRATGEVVLADLGLSRAVHARAFVEDRVRGSLGYVSPEQARGEAIDARADLYALGAILYEIVTGTLPVNPANPRDALRRLQLPPDPPSARVQDIDPALEALILALLAPDRTARPASASVVAERLAPFTGRPPVDRALRPALFVPPLVGREEERRRLSAALTAALLHGGLVCIDGPPGSGTTRLAAELAAAARAAGVLVAGGRGRLGELPLAPLAAVTERVAEVARVDDPVARWRGDPDAGDLGGLASKLASTWSSVATSRPLLVVVDDLDLAHPSAVEILGRVLGALWVSPARVAILVTTRAGPRSASLDALLAGGVVVAVPPLSVEASVAMAAGMLGAPELPAYLRVAVAERTGGSPLLVREWVATAVADGSLRQRGSSWVPATAPGAPSTLVGLLDSRLDHLSVDEVRLVAVAGLLGAALTEARLAGSGGRGDPVRAALAVRLLERDADGLRLVHPEIGVRALARVADPMRLAGEVLERFGPEVTPEQRAAWAEAAGRPEEAAQAWREAGDRDRHRHPASASAAWRRAYALAPQDALAADVAVVAGAIGDTGDLAWAADVLQRSPSPAHRSSGLVAAAQLALLSGRNAEAAAAAERASTGAAGDLSSLAAYTRFAALRKLATPSDQVLAAFREFGADSAVGRHVAAAVAFDQGRLTEAAASFEWLVEHHRAAGRWSEVVKALGNLASTLHRAGRSAEAHRGTVEAVLLARRFGLRETEAVRWLTVAQGYQRDGRSALALRSVGAGLAVAVADGQRWATERLLGAWSELDDGAEGLRAAELLGGWGLDPGQLGWGLVRRGRFDDALRWCVVRAGPELEPVHRGLVDDEGALEAWASGVDAADAALGWDVFHHHTGTARERVVAAWRAVPALPCATTALLRLGEVREPCLPDLPPLLFGALPSESGGLLEAAARRFR